MPTAFRHHVKSADNPADVASRGIDPDLLSDHELWWHGPRWLTESANSWPRLPDDLSSHLPSEKKNTRIELVSHVAAQASSPEERLWKLGLRFSTSSKLFRVTAYVIRFVQKLYLKIVNKFVISSFKFHSFLDLSEMHCEALKPSEIYNAKLFWIYQYQQAFFPEEIRSLSRTSQSRAKLPGALLKLNPVLKDELLRVGGRLDRSLLPMDP